MKILGADGLKGNTNAMERIPHGHISHGDCCCSKHNDKFYWYILEDDLVIPENPPYVIIPGGGGNSGYNGNKRWVLKNIFLTEVEVEQVLTNSVQPLSAGAPLDLAGALTLSGGNVIFENTDGAPFEVNSSLMVEGLNTEYWGGIHYSEFNLDELIVSGDQWISQGIDELFVAFPEPRFNISYSLFTELYNVVSPSIVQHIVVNKGLNGFTVRLSSKTDNSYYRIQWAILGENEQAEDYNLQDTLGNNILDTLGNQITVF